MRDICDESADLTPEISPAEHLAIRREGGWQAINNSLKEICVFRRRDGRVVIAQGDQEIVVPDIERLRGVIASLKTCEFVMTSKLYAQITEERQRAEREPEERER